MEKVIGDAAGKVWQTLKAKGPMPVAQVSKVTGLSGDVANQAIGWLAREGKLTAETKLSGTVLKLKS